MHIAFESLQLIPQMDQMQLIRKVILMSSHDYNPHRGFELEAEYKVQSVVLSDYDCDELISGFSSGKLKSIEEVVRHQAEPKVNKKVDDFI